MSERALRKAFDYYDGILAQAIQELAAHSKDLSGWQCDPIDDAVDAMRAARKKFAHLRRADDSEGSA